ncbi:MAG: transporter substrate-binding domain-containing protein [Burkholderiales bacterium]|nr:transporter substrate-binding domain-containing protein [Burkholderiales bacterium]MDE2158080.1 transporter substrate-binding domain-containing protein [Burkholderiales bacterium]MDE2504141.1 transporter substrate-binding domain-containing protein [Burkholderiales bacterium]
MNRRHCLGGIAAAAGFALGALPRAAAATTLEQVHKRGALLVAVYDDMPPFHVKGQGVDVDIAAALAGALGVKLSLLPFPADDSMNDDLRNMVWKGHYLGYGPADLLMHVPVERPLMMANPQVQIFAPYYRERVAIARNLARLPELESLQPLARLKTAVSGQSLAGWLMIGADQGAYREHLSTDWKDGTECARALQRGEVDAAAGLWSELETVLRGDARYAIEPLPMPRAPQDGWATGMAVKKDATDLARALQAAMDQLAGAGALKAIFARANLDWHTP